MTSYLRNHELKKIIHNYSKGSAKERIDE